MVASAIRAMRSLRRDAFAYDILSQAGRLVNFHLSLTSKRLGERGFLG